MVLVERAVVMFVVVYLVWAWCVLIGLMVSL